MARLVMAHVPKETRRFCLLFPRVQHSHDDGSSSTETAILGIHLSLFRRCFKTRFMQQRTTSGNQTSHFTSQPNENKSPAKKTTRTTRVRRWCGARGGGPRWRGAGWKMGGGGERLLWPCSFSEARIRPSEADSFCGHLQVVAASSSRWQEVRRRRRRLGVWGKCWI
jgi:hypothetical protein